MHMGKSLTGKKLDRGITQRKDGRYMARFTNRFGKRVTIYDDDLTILKKKFRELQYENDKKQNVISSNMTLNNWFDVWLNTYKKHVKAGTRQNYIVRYNRIKPYLGEKKLNSIRKTDVQNCLNELETDRSREQSNVILKDMFQYAVDNELITKNPATKVNTTITGEPKREKRILSDTEIEMILSINSYATLLIATGICTGMRIGEVLGLTWDCVDLENNTIQINKTLMYLSDTKYYFSTPKSKNSNRIIPINSYLKDVLMKQYQRKQEIESKYTAPEGFENLVFVSRNNRPLNESNICSLIRTQIKRVKKVYGTDIESFSFHCLRHTFATKCIESNINPATVQRYLGHSDYTTTMNIYCHISNDTLFSEMSKLQMPQPKI